MYSIQYDVDILWKYSFVIVNFFFYDKIFEENLKNPDINPKIYIYIYQETTMTRSLSN